MKNAAALITVTYNKFDIFKKCLTSIYKYSTFPYHLFIIDNCSSDDTLGLYGSVLKNTTIIRNNENKWWVGGINQGLELSKDYKYTFFLNNDIEVCPNWIESHINVLDTNKRIGAVGPMNSAPRDWQFYDRVKATFSDLNLPDLGNLDRNDVFGVNSFLKESFKGRFCHIKGMLAFFCVAFRREVIDQIGYLDKDFTEVIAGDDDEYCTRLEKSGYVLSLLLDTYILHHAGVSKNTLPDVNERANKASMLLKQKYPEKYKTV